MQTALGGNEFDRRLVFRNGIYMPVGLGVRLGNDLMYAPGMCIDFEHPAIAVLGYQ